MGFFDKIFGGKKKNASAPQPVTAPAQAPAQPTSPYSTPLRNHQPMAATSADVLSYLRQRPAGITLVHGNAGSGLTQLVEDILSNIPSCKILTVTKAAASRYDEAYTIRSFFRDAFDDLHRKIQRPENVSPVRAAKVAHKLAGISMLVFDEISMVRADAFEMMNQIFQKALNNSMPFGGIPVVAIGDLFVYDPVVIDDNANAYLRKQYGGIHFYHSPVVKDNLDKIKLFELPTSYDKQFSYAYSRYLDSFRRPMDEKTKKEQLKKLNSHFALLKPSDCAIISPSLEKATDTDGLQQMIGQTLTIDTENIDDDNDSLINVVINCEVCQKISFNGSTVSINFDGNDCSINSDDTSIDCDDVKIYDKVMIDYSEFDFSPGQFYAAMHYGKSLDALNIYSGFFSSAKFEYRDIVSDESIFVFLDILRGANLAAPAPATNQKGASAPPAPAPSAPTPSPKIRNPRCDDFISFVTLHERDLDTKTYLCDTLTVYKLYFADENTDSALRELTKVIDKVCSAYVTDRYDLLLQRLRSIGPTIEDCKYGLNAIFEIYTDVVSRPRRHQSSGNDNLENKT